VDSCPFSVFVIQAVPLPSPSAGALSLDRVLGCLLGGAIGDALGYPIEFVQTEAEIIDQFGAGPPAELAYAGPALVSDDTQMTLFSAEALVRARGAGPEELPRYALGAYQRWYATQRTSPRDASPGPNDGLLLADGRLYAQRAPGQTCLAALAQSFTRPAPGSVDDPPNDSKGCGAVMRAAPFGIAARDREAAFRAARDAAALTHGHPSGYLSAAYLASLIYDLVRGATLRDAIIAANDVLTGYKIAAEVAWAIADARFVAGRGPVTAQALEALGGGWVGEEALGIAVACALGATAGSVAQALWRAVAHGGDSDSTGSIAGNLVGALYGAEALPARWRAQVDVGDLVTRVAQDLHAVAAGGAPDPNAYPPVPGGLRLAPLTRDR
jgi:ADP-ribosylglycohydrolase